MRIYKELNNNEKPNSAEEFGELQELFQSAIDVMKVKLNDLTNQSQTIFQRNLIHCVECRLKSTASIMKKLTIKCLETNVQAARANLTDIAGVRVICNYIDDIYIIEELICSLDDISLIRKNDYIKNPKPNGYRSLHLVIKVPVIVNGIKEYLPVEIQIRSIAMDFWASLEHQIYYKCGCNNAPDILVKRLMECADNIAKIDIEMQDISKELGRSCHKTL